MGVPSNQDYLALNEAISRSDTNSGLPNGYHPLYDNNGTALTYRDNITGLVAQAYIKYDNTIVVAFEGTQATGAEIFGQLSADFSIFAGIKPAAFDQANAFVQAVRAVAPAGAEIYTTGHSLGGAIVQYVDSNNSDISGVTFGSPQIGLIAHGAYTLNTLNYVDVNDSITNGTSGGYIGAVQYVDTTKPLTNQSPISGVGYHRLANYERLFGAVPSSYLPSSAGLIMEALAAADKAANGTDDLNGFSIGPDGTIYSGNGHITINTLPNGGQISITYLGSMIVDRENPDGTSSITTTNPDGASVTVTYTGPSGTGRPISSDTERPDGTSIIRAYNPDGSSTAKTYSGPNGSGTVISTESYDASGNLKSGDYNLPGGGRLHLTPGAQAPTGIKETTDSSGKVHLSGTFNGATLTAFGGIVSFSLDGGWGNVDYSAFPHSYGKFIEAGSATILPQPSDTVSLQGIAFLYRGQTSLQPGFGYWTSTTQDSGHGYSVFLSTDVTMLPDYSRNDGLFDRGYYSTTYPAVLTAGIDMLAVYESTGWKQGQNPSASFDTNAYLNTYADALAAGIDPLSYYETIGKALGETPISVADAKARGIDGSPFTTLTPSTPAAPVSPSSSGQGSGTSPGASTPTPITPARVVASVYRFFDTHYGTEFLTSSSDELHQLQATRSDLSYEGVGLNSVDAGAADPNASSVYRFFDTVYGTHFYSSSASERDTILATRSDLTYEGTGFYEYATPQANTTPVYRFFESTNGTHFYTTSAPERAVILTTRPDMVAEGTAFYAPT